MSKFKKVKTGFTLIEIVVVVVLISILVAIAVPRYSNLTGNADTAKIEANAQTVLSAIHMYQSENEGSTPSTANDLAPFLSGGIPTGIVVDFANFVIEDTSGSVLFTY